jgi:hypothetical protein
VNLIVRKANLELINKGVDIIGKVRSGKNPQTLAKTQKALNVKLRKKANYFRSDGCFVCSTYFPEN